MKLSLLPVIALLFITGCATSPKIQVVQAGDNKIKQATTKCRVNNSKKT